MDSSLYFDIGICFLSKGQTINSDYCNCIIGSIGCRNKVKEASDGKENGLFHQDNVPIRKSIKTIVKWNELQVELLSTPYSPDLAPSTFYLFADLKKILPDGVLHIMRPNTKASLSVFGQIKYQLCFILSFIVHNR